jgi:hypothetical protein
MPRATVAVDSQTFKLETCPDGWVKIRRMTYGEKLTRQDDMMNMQTSTKDDMMNIRIQAKKMALVDFANLILEHNLTDENDVPLNFKNAADVAKLDPRIGDEIGKYIDSINSFEDEASTKNF